MALEKLPQDQSPNLILKFLADDKRSISYRPTLTKLTGSVTATVLLQQIIYWWSNAGCKAFYKFKEPCGHVAYRKNDSWCEELALSRMEFDGAIKKIGTKVSKAQTSAVVRKFQLPSRSDFTDDNDFGAAMIIAVQHIVIYWRDGNNKTWYDINADLFSRLVELLYDGTDANEGILLSLGKEGFLRSLENAGKRRSLITETTHETTQIEDSLLSKPAAQASTTQTPPEVETAGIWYCTADHKRHKSYISPSGTHYLCNLPSNAPVTTQPWLDLTYADCPVCFGLPPVAIPGQGKVTVIEVDLNTPPSVAVVPPAADNQPEAVSSVPAATLEALEVPYQWVVSSGQGTSAHIAKSVKGRLLCGATLTHRESLNAPIGPREPCGDCRGLYQIQLAEKSAPKPPRPPRKPQLWDSLFDTIGSVVLSAKTSADVEAVKWRINQIIHGDKKHHRTDGLIAYEAARRDKDELSAEDFAALAQEIKPFWDWYQTGHVGYELKDCGKFMEQWVAWRSTATPAIPAEDQKLVPHPEIPGATMTVAQLRRWHKSQQMLKEAQHGNS